MRGRWSRTESLMMISSCCRRRPTTAGDRNISASGPWSHGSFGSESEEYFETDQRSFVGGHRPERSIVPLSSQQSRQGASENGHCGGVGYRDETGERVEEIDPRPGTVLQLMPADDFDQRESHRPPPLGRRTERA